MAVAAQPIVCGAAAAHRPNSAGRPTIEGEVARKHVGNEPVSGRKTEKYEVTVESDGKRQIIYQWVAPDIKFTMKTASADGKWESVYSSVTIGPQRPDLFDLPAGYTKVSVQK